MTTWLAVLAVVVLGLGIITCLLWAGSSRQAQRRKARVAREIAAAYRRERARDTDATKAVTVAELVARVEGEGLAVRLNWRREDEDSCGSDEDEWPTGIIERIVDDNFNS